MGTSIKWGGMAIGIWPSVQPSLSRQNEDEEGSFPAGNGQNTISRGGDGDELSDPKEPSSSIPYARVMPKNRRSKHNPLRPLHSKCMVLVLGFAVSFSLACASLTPADDDLHFSSIVVDGHSDTTPRFADPDWNFGERHSDADGDMDLPRIREGGRG